MKEAMDKALDEAWRKRAAGLPLPTAASADACLDRREERQFRRNEPRSAAVYITGCAAR